MTSWSSPECGGIWRADSWPQGLDIYSFHPATQPFFSISCFVLPWRAYLVNCGHPSLCTQVPFPMPSQIMPFAHSSGGGASWDETTDLGKGLCHPWKYGEHCSRKEFWILSIQMVVCGQVGSPSPIDSSPLGVGMT